MNDNMKHNMRDVSEVTLRIPIINYLLFIFIGNGTNNRLTTVTTARKIT